MRSKTSFFNSALFKKNMTRFAPMWGLYTLCLLLGTLLLYTNGGVAKQYHFASNMADMLQIMAVINLVYAPIVAQLLFGDLYTGRMCNAIHAMPVSRESIYGTNLLSGILFSVVPMLVMTAVSIPLLADSCVADATRIPWYLLGASTLEYLCFFGIAVFCAMCAGNRLGMLVIYGIMNFLASIVYWFIDTLYTPMLYGVVTPTALSEKLTPVLYMGDHSYLEIADYYSDLAEKYNGDLDQILTSFSVTENWPILFAYAAAGIVFLAIGLVLYRKRHLECAGDALAFKCLEPVFQVLVALITAVGGQYLLEIFIGYYDHGFSYYVFLAAGLLVGWFGCRMLIERSARVFRLKNFLGLAGVAAVLALSLLATYLDFFGIHTWIPQAEKIESVRFTSDYSNGPVLTDPQEIAEILVMHREALGEELESDGPYVQALDGNWVYNIDTNSALIGKEQSEITDCRYAYSASITYTMKSGKVVRRRYFLWNDGPSADTARMLLSDWERVINRRYADEEFNVESVLTGTIRTLDVSGMDRIKDPDRELVDGLIEAVKLDCAEGNMAQNPYLHRGHFIRQKPNDRGEHPKAYSVDIYINSYTHGTYLEIYADASHTIAYLRGHGLLAYDVSTANLHYN